MIIFCDSGGNVNSVPSTMPFGSALTDITIVAFEMAATAVLKIKPPNQQYSPGIVCAPVIQDGVVVYQAKLNKAVTNTFGRCEYQIEFYLQDGDDVPIVSTYSGSFNVSRGVPVDLPASEELLKDMALENIYAALSSVTRLAEEITALLEFTGAETELQTAAKNLAGAVNELYARPVVYVDATLTKSGDAADAKVTGELIRNLDEAKVGFGDVVNDLATNSIQKPLSAAQGVILKNLVVELQTALDSLARSMVTIDKINKAIGEHNQDETAHPALIAAIQAVYDTVNGLNVDGKIADALFSHNTNPEAHQDIRIVLQGLFDQVNHFLDVDDTTRDQLSELLALIEDNIDDIEQITVDKVKYTDIINNLETNLDNKVLSAAQGVVIKGLIDGLNTALTTLGTRTTTLEGKVTTLENTKPDMSGYVTTEQFEAALAAYITDIDNIVGGGIQIPKLPTPVIRIEDGLVKGDAVPNASGYNLYETNAGFVVYQACGRYEGAFDYWGYIDNDGSFVDTGVPDLCTDYIHLDSLANDETKNICVNLTGDANIPTRVLAAFYKKYGDYSSFVGRLDSDGLMNIGLKAEDIKGYANSLGAKYVRFCSLQNENSPAWVYFTNDILISIENRADVNYGDKLIVKAISDDINYLDSDYSNEVTYQAPTIITFTINGISYQAEEDMTWLEWCESDYNTGGYKINDSNHLVSSNGILVEQNYNSLLASASPSAGVSYMTADVTTLTIINSDNNSESITLFVPVDITFQNLVRSEYDTTNGALTLRASDNRVCYNDKPLYTQTGSDFANTYNTNIANGTFYYSSAATLISFTIDGTTYQAEAGMTWEQWCASEYNTGYNGEDWIADTYVAAWGNNYVSTNGSISGRVRSTDTITADYAYSIYMD